MGLKITSETGFVIGGTPNPSIKEIFLRANVDMNKQNFVYSKEEGKENEIEEVSIQTTAKTTVLGGIKDNYIQINNISPIYWLSYSANIVDMNELYLEIETELKDILLVKNPDWTIEIVHLGIY